MGRTGDEGSFVGTQIQNEINDFNGFSGPSQKGFHVGHTRTGQHGTGNDTAGTHTVRSPQRCQGFCQMGPLMRIEPEGIMYVKVKEEDVPEIVEKTLLNGEIIDRLTYVNPADQKHYAREEEIPFYAKQHRVVMKNCTIEPNSIGEYLSKRGYEGAKKAYTQMS